MLLALTDQLRCTEAHADSWLVARADVVEAGRMVEGVLGCPVCQAERAVHRGVVYWSGTEAERASNGAGDPHPDRVIRIGALLAFGDSPMPFVLCGAEAAVASSLSALSDVPLVLLDPADDRAVLFASIVRGVPAIPFGGGSVRGIALDAGHCAPGFIASCVHALAPGGRLVAPAATPVPDGVRELARDAEHWVAEREAAPVTVPLSRVARN